MYSTAPRTAGLHAFGEVSLDDGNAAAMGFWRGRSRSRKKTAGQMPRVVYAQASPHSLGGTPLFALNLVGWPRGKLPFELPF